MSQECKVANCNSEVVQDGYCEECYERWYHKPVSSASKAKATKSQEIVKNKELEKLETRIQVMRKGLDAMLSGAKGKDDLARKTQDVMKAEMALSIIKDIMTGKWDEVPLVKKLALFKDMLKATTPVFSAPSYLQFNIGQVKEVQAKTAKGIIDMLPKPTVAMKGV